MNDEELSEIIELIDEIDKTDLEEFERSISEQLNSSSNLVDYESVLLNPIPVRSRSSILIALEQGYADYFETKM